MKIVKRRTLAMILAAAMVLGLCSGYALAAVPAQADQTQPVETIPLDYDTAEELYVEAEQASNTASSQESEQSQEAAQSQASDVQTRSEEDNIAQEVEVTPDAVGTVSFSNISSRMRENNFNILALQENIASIEAMDYDQLTDDLRDNLNALAKSQYSMIHLNQNLTNLSIMTGGSGLSLGEQAALSVSTSSSLQSLESAYSSVRETYEDLRDGKVQADNAAVVRQLENAQNQIIMAGESLYIALAGMELTDRGLDRQLDALDRTIEELELRYDLGQVSSLTLQQTKGGRTSLVSGQRTLEMNISTYKAQLEMLLGAEQTGNIKLQSLAQVTNQQINAMDLEADLAAAKEASYTLFDAQRTLEDAQETFEDSGKDHHYNEKVYEYAMAIHTWQAAQHTYNATLQSFENSFRTLYYQVQDYKQVLDAAKTALSVEQHNYQVDQLKYDQGTISQNTLLEAKDDLSAAQDKVTSAAIDLFSAYNNYRWAVDYGILN